jgi:transposase
MSTFLAVKALHESGAPKKTIARQLDIDPRTVRKYVRRLAAGAACPERTKPAGKLDPVLEIVRAKVDCGLSAVQIHQDLCARPDFDVSYESVKRLVRRLRPAEPEVFCRMSYRPGEEAQIDFGDVGRLLVGEVFRKAHLFAMTLCFSRRSYYELVLDQRVPTFLGAIRRGFEFLGGVPRRLKPDNLKSAVLVSQLGERYYQEDFFRFCRHYGVIPEAARPATPTDKGRTERDIGYVKGSCFRGRSFSSFEEAQAHLASWRDAIANVRVHGTTRRRPIELFEEEKASLLPLPTDPFEVAIFGRYKVRKDCHVHVDGNYYSAPYTLVGREVVVRISEREVSVFDDGERVALHTRALGKGETVTDSEHYPPTKRIATQEIHRRRVLEVRSAGARTAQFVGELRRSPFVLGDQVARLAVLLSRFGADRLERACARALFFGAADSARAVERILEKGLEALDLPGAERSGECAGSDFGRPLGEYDALLAGAEVGR